MKLITQVLLLLMTCVVGALADGVISANNLGGLPVLGEDSLPLAMTVARVEVLDGSHGPFLEDRYSFSFVSEPGTSGYEGILHPDDRTRPLIQWLGIELAIAPPELSVERRGGNFAVKVGRNWSPSNSLYQSTDLKTWTSSFNQRLDFIYTNRVFEIPDTNGASLFFKAQ